MDRVFSPPFDAGIPAVAIFVGLTWAGVVFVAVLLFEALILWRWLKVSWWRSLVYSLLMNVTSTIAGIILTWYFLSWFNGLGFFVLYVVFAVALSILIEGLVLRLLEPGRPSGEIWAATATANFLGYIVLIGMWGVLVIGLPLVGWLSSFFR